MELGGVAVAVATAAVLTVAIEAEIRNAVICMLYEPRHRPLLPPPRFGDKFILNRFTEVKYQKYFRFTQAEIWQILQYLGLDEIVY